MSKKVSEMTEEERKRVREVERKRRAAKKAGSKLLAKTAEKKTPAPKKCDKKVVLDGKIKLNGGTEVVEPVRIHFVKPNDIVKFVGFSAERLIQFAVNIIKDN